MSTVTPDQFRADFPAFNCTTTYPDPSVQFFLTLADKLHNADRWGELLSAGIELYTAHNLALERASQRNGQGVPGAVIGALESATVDKVSYSRSTAGIINPKDGHWNLTTYGMRYRTLVNMVGAGPIQVGVDGCGNAAGAWQGPSIYPPY